MLRIYLQWAKGLGATGIFIAVVMLTIMVSIVGLFDKEQARRGLEGKLVIPAYGNLTTATGTLERAVGTGGGRSYFVFGLLMSDQQEFIGFSCNPADSDMGCIYSTPYYKSPLIGEPVVIRYFLMPNWLYPEYDVQVQTPMGLVSKHVPRQPAAIIMEATVEDAAGPSKVLSYETSSARLGQYNATPRLSPFDIVACLITALFFPGLAYRVLTGPSTSEY